MDGPIRCVFFPPGPSRIVNNSCLQNSNCNGVAELNIGNVSVFWRNPGDYCTDNPDIVFHFRGGVLGSSSFPGVSAEGWVLNFYNRMRK
jgi:hypothetical protein